MDNEADYAREYERLRAELADFVVNAVAEQMASGERPELSQKLVEAIDRRVEEAVTARLAQAEWPDPDAFADQVLAAAAGRGGGEAYRARPRSIDDARRPTRKAPGKSGGFTRVQAILLGLILVGIIAAAVYFLFLRTPAPVRTETRGNVTFIEPTPDGATNVQQPPANGVAPPAATQTNQVQPR